MSIGDDAAYEGPLPCPVCGSDLAGRHTLVSASVSPMKNGARVIDPTCSACQTRVTVEAVAPAIGRTRKVLLISGPVGAGKSTIGQLIEQHYPYVFIDGDAMSKKINHMAALDHTVKRDEHQYHGETIRTMLVTLGLGYNVVVGYVLLPAGLRRYRDSLAAYAIEPLVRVLLPTRDACLQRDLGRPCWTAGVEFVDRWYADQCQFRDTDPAICIDTTAETPWETVERHLHHYL